MRVLQTTAAAAFLCLACGQQADRDKSGPDSGPIADAGDPADATIMGTDAAATSGTLEARIRFGPSALDCAKAGVSQVDINVDGIPVLENQSCDTSRPYAIPAIEFGSRQVGVVSWSPNLWEGSQVVIHAHQTGGAEVLLTQVENPQ